MLHGNPTDALMQVDELSLATKTLILFRANGRKRK
jgi:hypothetical protein